MARLPLSRAEEQVSLHAFVFFFVSMRFMIAPSRPPSTPDAAGIGKRIALELAMLGAQVFIASRKLDVLRKAATEINTRV